jgi:hypothetical protein
MEMEKVVHKFLRGEEPKSYVYWLTRPPIERLIALEELRERYKSLIHVSDERLQRVLRITKRA